MPERRDNSNGTIPSYEMQRMKESGYRYMRGRMNISSSVVPNEQYRLEKEYDRSRKAVGLDKNGK